MKCLCPNKKSSGRDMTFATLKVADRPSGLKSMKVVEPIVAAWAAVKSPTADW